MASIYRQQLEAVLFSLNQYAWDVAGGWATSISQVLGGARKGREEELAEGLGRLNDRAPVLAGAFVADTSGSNLVVAVFVLRAAAPPESQGHSSGSPAVAPDTGTAGAGAFSEPALRAAVTRALAEQRGRIERLVRYQKSAYRSIERIPLPGDTTHALLVFVAPDPHTGVRLAGVVVNEDLFLRSLLFSRIQDAAGDRFVLGVVEESHDRVLLSTEPVSPGELHQRRRLWLFPDRALGIRLRGESIEDIVRVRLQRNIVLLVLLDLVLLAGAWAVYRGLRKELEFARMKSDFVSTVSHELRTPLALIRMYSETLEMERIADLAKKKLYVATILRETERLTRLVNNILNFSRIDAGRKEYRFGRVDLNAVVSDVLETFREQLTQDGFAPEVSLDPGLPPIRADGEAVGQALINLVDNAVKYSGESRYLKVSTGRAEGMACVQVDDHGVGIASPHHQKIFETFYRVIDGAVQGARGSGLGLALVKHILDAHEGRIRLESSPGRGSSFRLLFPFHAQTGES
jgi:two-component system phosphate regulon sensor histidine kinase PhoR